jgi:hypothetical protein
MQITPECRGTVHSAGFENVYQIAAGQYYDGMSVLADLPVGLGVQVRCGDQYAELAMPQPRDEPACFPDSHAVGRAVALGSRANSTATGSERGPRR